METKQVEEILLRPSRTRAQLDGLTDDLAELCAIATRTTTNASLPTVITSRNVALMDDIVAEIDNLTTKRNRCMLQYAGERQQVRAMIRCVSARAK